MTNKKEEILTQKLTSVSVGGLQFFTGRILGRGFRFGFNLLVASRLGAGLYGIFALGWRISKILTSFSHFGAAQSIMKYLPQYEGERRYRILGLAYLTAIVGSSIIGVLLFILAPLVSEVTIDSRLFVKVLRIFSLLIPIKTIAVVSKSVFQGLKKLKYKIIIEDIIVPGFEIVGAAVALLLGASVVGVTAAVLVAWIIGVLTAVRLLLSKTELKLSRPVRGETKEFLGFSLPLVFADVGWILNSRIDILMVGTFISATGVGIYNIAVLVSGLLLLPLTAVNQLFPPIASELYGDQDYEKLSSIYKSTTRWIFYLVLPSAAVMGIFRHDILQIFGSEFTGGETILALFVGAQIINSAVGPSGYMLMISEHQYLKMVNQWSFGVLNIVFNYVFILKYGIFGAALATAVAIAGLNLVRVIEVWYLEGLSPYSKSLWKPILGAIGSSFPVLLIQYNMNGLLSIIIGAIVGFATFICLICLFGLETEDEALIKSQFS